MSRPRAHMSNAVVLVLAIAASIAVATPSGAAETTSISGVAFEDHDRDGAYGAGDAPLAGHQLYLLADGATLVDTVATAADGSYAFVGLAPGDYLVRYASSSWKAIRAEWVPTTTGSVWPEVAVTVPDSARVEFGWRRIATSSTLGLPMSSYTGPDGLRVESYTDAVDARTVHGAMAAGALVGDESASTMIRFGHGDVSATTSTVQSSGGVYTSYSATVAVSYHSWLDGYDETLFHEYGHAWAGYFGSVVQQDPELTGYLHARGLLGDPRVNSSYAWSVGEMIAEDYRQLFGTPTAAAAPQINSEIPPATEVAGLADYLRGPFRQPPATEPRDQSDPADADSSDPDTTDTGTTDTDTDTSTKGNGKGGGKSGGGEPGGGSGGGNGKVK